MESKAVHEPIYVAGGYYIEEERQPDHKKFELVTPGKGKDIPYLTRNIKGLKLTSHHANLYRLSEDIKTAKMVELRCIQVSDFEVVGGSVIPVTEVKLTEKQMLSVKAAIESNFFSE